MSMNEAFAANMTGKHVKFDIQPYSRGEGYIRKVEPRIVETRQYLPDHGRTEMRYEVFDLEVEVTKGSRVGALLCGVPVSPPKDSAGRTETIIGVGYRQLYEACTNGATIVIARCG
jgi:hypothetical protein